MRMRCSVALSRSLAVALFAAATVLAGVANGSVGLPPGFHLQPQEKLLDRACNAAAARIENMMSRAWATQAGTVQTPVRVLRPGKLAGDIAFNPSGNSISIAGDTSPISTEGFACGYGQAGSQSGSGTASAGIGHNIPKKHVVALVRATFTAPGRYTLTFTLNPKGRRLLARLGAQQRAYRKHHPQGKLPPMITWGIGLRFFATG